MTAANQQVGGFTDSTEPDVARHCHAIVRVASIAGMVVGIVVLIGWLLRIEFLTSIVPGYATMKPNTALCFSLSGFSLWLLHVRCLDAKPILAARILGALVALAGGLTLCEHWLGWDLGFDAFLFHNTLIATSVAHPGRFSQATAFGLFLLGSSLFFAGRKFHRYCEPSQWLALAAMVVAAIGQFGYVFGAQSLYHFPAYATMALHTAITLTLLGIGTLLLRPDRGLMAVITSQHSGGTLARCILPLSVALPLVFSWLQLQALHAAFVGNEFGQAVLVMFDIIFLAALVWVGARFLNKADARHLESQAELHRAHEELERRVAERTAELVAEIDERKQAEKALVESERKFRTLFDAATDAIFIVHKGLFVDCNARGLDLFGVSRDQLIGQSPLLFMPSNQPNGRDSQETMRESMERVLAGEPYSGDWVHRHSNGTLVHADVSASRLELGGEVYIQAIVHDITERKKTEEQLLWKTAFFEAQVYSAFDGILVVDGDGKKILQNQRMIDLWNIPRQVADGLDDGPELEWVTTQVKNPRQFVEKVVYLYAHPDEVGRDELELIDGRFLDRYSAPVRGKDGKYYGRIWTFRDTTQRKQAEAALEKAHKELFAASRQAGMAEVATSVLHNVGNVLNSANISLGVATEKISQLKTTSLGRIAGLLREHAENLPAFFADHPQGTRLPQFLAQLAGHFAADQKTVLDELDSLRNNIEHINEIIAMQQSYATAGGVIETLPLSELIEGFWCKFQKRSARGPGRPRRKGVTRLPNRA